jgi:hydrogenase maturation protease
LAVRIIGVGQQWAGDDGVGLAVIRGIRELDPRLDTVEVEEPTRLIDLLTDGADPVVIVDGLDDAPAGRVLMINSGQRDPRAQRLLSTHGVGVMEAIELARIAHPERVARRIFIVGVTIQQTSRGGEGLSPAVEAAVPRAAAKVLEIAIRG